MHWRAASRPRVGAASGAQVKVHAQRDAWRPRLCDNHGAMRLPVALVSAAAVIALAAPAHADATQDHNFVVSLQAAGITYTSPESAVAAGKHVCEIANAVKPGVEVPKTLHSQT